MKLIEAIGTAVLSLTIGVAVPAYAQDQQDKQEERAKPAQEEKKAEPAKPKKQEEKNAQQQDKNNQQEQKNAQQQDWNNKQEEKNAQQQHNQPSQQHSSASRIPAERYRANFGREHSFRVSRDDYSRDRRFQYGGYWFGFVDPWPTNWLYTQDVYVIEIDGMYYLCNPAYPGVNVAINVTL
jgi:hypothetical protein